MRPKLFPSSFIITLFMILIFATPVTAAVARYKKKPEYLILDCPIHGNGLFSVFTMVLGLLQKYETGKCVGCEINFEDIGVYYDESMGPNWWEYYFEPIQLGTKDGATIRKTGDNEKIKLAGLCEFRTSREDNHIYIDKYIRLKSHIDQKLTEFQNSQFTDHWMIGVHYRGTDKIGEAPRIRYAEVSKNVDTLIQSYSGTLPYRIYVATDEQAFIEYMQEQYPESVVFLDDAIRSTNGKPVHQSEMVQNYKKGEDAILDCILLSRCDILVRTSSNLSLISTFFNADIPVIELTKRY